MGSDGGGRQDGGGGGVINVSQTRPFPPEAGCLSSSSSFSLISINYTPHLPFCSRPPVTAAPLSLGMNFLSFFFFFCGIRLARAGRGYGCGEDSSGFTQGRVSPRGDSEMSASVSLCLSSAPRQRRLCRRLIAALSPRVSFCLVI